MLTLNSCRKLKEYYTDKFLKSLENSHYLGCFILVFVLFLFFSEWKPPRSITSPELAVRWCFGIGPTKMTRCATLSLLGEIRNLSLLWHPDLSQRLPVLMRAPSAGKTLFRWSTTHAYVASSRMATEADRGKNLPDQPRPHSGRQEDG